MTLITIAVSYRCNFLIVTLKHNNQLIIIDAINDIQNISPVIENLSKYEKLYLKRNDNVQYIIFSTSKHMHTHVYVYMKPYMIIENYSFLKIISITYLN